MEKNLRKLKMKFFLFLIFFEMDFLNMNIWKYMDFDNNI